MAYDEFGWIVNVDKETRIAKDRGDSCFFMALQTLNFILQYQITKSRISYEKAKILYEKVKEWDFIRHPSVKRFGDSYYNNQTSYDMMMLWDYIASRYGEYGFDYPPFHYRKSKFLSGRFRNPLMYLLPIGFVVLLVLMFVLHLRSLAERLFFGKKFHKLHILMVYLAVIYERTKSLMFLRCYRKLVKQIEEILGYEHHFFRYLAHLPIDKSWKPEHNCWEWVYQRDLRFGCHPYRYLIEFHEEDGKDLSEQFIEYVV